MNDSVSGTDGIVQQGAQSLQTEQRSRSLLGFILNDPFASLSGLVCLIGFGGFMLWASLAPLAEGVIVTGQIVVEDNRKVVQHLGGGIVTQLNVVEGSTVEAGSVIMTLDDIGARTERNQAAERLFGLLASVDRLNALAANQEFLEFREFNELTDVSLEESIRQKIANRQLSLFSQQRESHRSELAVLNAREKSLTESAAAKESQLKVLARSIAVIADELAVKKPLLKEKLIRVDEVQRLEREQVEIQTTYSDAKVSQQDDLAQASVVREQLGAAKAQLQERISTELVATRSEILSIKSQYHTADDVLRRTVITAPQSGTVMNMRFFTLGGVVQSGESIMEIVPQDTALVAQVQIRPADRESVYEGLAVKARLSAYNQWIAPQIDGEVLAVSADLKTIPESGDSYYEARILLNDEQLQQNDSIEVIPGMPIEAFVDSGSKRTMIDYLFEPIAGVIRRGI